MPFDVNEDLDESDEIEDGTRTKKRGDGDLLPPLNRQQYVIVFGTAPAFAL